MSDYVYNSNNSKSLPLRNGLIGGKSVFGYVILFSLQPIKRILKTVV